MGFVWHFQKKPCNCWGLAGQNTGCNAHHRLLPSPLRTPFAHGLLFGKVSTFGVRSQAILSPWNRMWFGWVEARCLVSTIAREIFQEPIGSNCSNATMLPPYLMHLPFPNMTHCCIPLGNAGDGLMLWILCSLWEGDGIKHSVSYCL